MDVITVEELKFRRCCQAGIDWAIRNKLIGMPIENIKGIKGDYKQYIATLKENMKRSRDYYKSIHSARESRGETINDCGPSEILDGGIFDPDTNQLLCIPIPIKGKQIGYNFSYYPNGQLEKISTYTRDISAPKKTILWIPRF